jgi:hypothetical protein
MGLFLIGYDLIKPGKNYNELFEAIKSLSTTWWHCLDSTWIIKSSRSEAQIRDSLLNHIDANDRLLVVSLSGGWASYGFNGECTSWLKSNL